MRRWLSDGRAEGRRGRRLCVALGLAAGFAGGAGLAPSGALANEPELRVRKSVAALNATERRRYVDAVLELKATPSPYRPGISWYDQFVAWHVDLARCNPADPLAEGMMMGHGGPVFLPWHRQFLLMFEDALRTVSGRDVTVPYWDWSDPASTSALLADDFMGGDGDPDEGYAVTSGPFRRESWPLVVQNVGQVRGRRRAPLETRCSAARTASSPAFRSARAGCTTSSTPGSAARSATGRRA